MRVEELDASNTGEFKRDIAPVLEANDELVPDLSRRRFVDSSGLGAFNSCLRKLNAKGGGLTLSGMSRQVRAVFELDFRHAGSGPARGRPPQKSSLRDTITSVMEVLCL